MIKEIRKELFLAVGILLILFFVGVVGYMFVERWNFFDSMYMTVITLATVGFGETNPLSLNGRIFTMFLIIFGITTFVYAISRLQTFFIEGELSGILRREKMESKIKNLKDHYIVCGSGDVGKTVIKELLLTKKDFVVIENDKTNYELLIKDETILAINGNPTEDKILLLSGIKKAKGLICTLPSDKDNLFIVISARNLNPNIRIITRALEVDSVPKLKIAGADSVVSTDVIGGMRMVSEAIRPTVVSFLDSMLRDTNACLRFEEIVISPNSNIIGKTLYEAQIYEKTGLFPIAIKNNENNTYLYNPTLDYKISEKDILIVIGDINKISVAREVIR